MKKTKPIFVISLNDKERRFIVQKHLEENELFFSFFDATNGKSLTDSYFQNEFGSTYSNILKRKMNLGELGCLHSHFSIWQYIVKNKINNALILEDDARMTIQKNEFETILDNLPKNFRLVYLGFRGFTLKPLKFKLLLYTYYPIKSLFRNDFNGYTYNELKNIYSKHYNNKFDYAGAHHGSHAYIISLQGASDLLEICKSSIEPADIFIGRYAIQNRGLTFKTKKQVFSPDSNLQSTIHLGLKNRT